MSFLSNDGQESPTDSVFSSPTSTHSTAATLSSEVADSDTDSVVSEPLTYDPPERCASAPPATASDGKGDRSFNYTSSDRETFPGLCDRCQLLSIDFEEACMAQMNSREIEYQALQEENKTLLNNLRMAEMDLEGHRLSGEILNLQLQMAQGQNMQIAKENEELTASLASERAEKESILSSAALFSHQVSNAASTWRKQTLAKSQADKSEYDPGAKIVGNQTAQGTKSSMKGSKSRVPRARKAVPSF